MKIGSKIALFYTVITVGAIALIVLVFYLFTLRYINKVYDSYLSEKAYLTAQKYWEKDEVDESRYREIQQKYDDLLPQAYEILLNADSVTAVADTLAKYLDRHQQARLFKNEPVTFVYGRLRGAALYYPDNEGNFVVLVMASNHYGQDIQKHILMLAFLLLALSCGLVFLIGKVYANRILLPLQHLLKDLKRIRVNNLNVRLETFGNKDEWDELIRALNEMLDHLDTAFQAEKAFISNASHELNNPLTAIQGECEICLLKRRPAEEYEEALRRIADESRRISMLIKHLLFLSRHDEDILCRGTETVELAVLLQDLCRQYERVRFDVTGIGAGSELRADSHLLRVAFRNIIDNACKYSQEDVEVRMVRMEDGVKVEVLDHGIGIPEDDIRYIFNSFYRAGNVREYHGQGIGLSLSMRILKVYGGRISIDSCQGQYTKVTVIFKSSPKTK